MHASDRTSGSPLPGGPLPVLSTVLDASGPAMFPSEVSPDEGDFEELLTFRKALRSRRPDDSGRVLGVADALLRLGRAEEALELAAEVERSGGSCPCCVEEVIVSALEVLGRNPRDYPWTGCGPRFVALDPPTLDHCYRFLKRKRTFRPAVELLVEVFGAQRLTFDQRQLLEAMRTDGRFHIRRDGQVKAKRRSKRRTPVH